LPIIVAQHLNFGSLFAQDRKRSPANKSGQAARAWPQNARGIDLAVIFPKMYDFRRLIFKVFAAPLDFIRFL
jgi:hypothetical protein